MELFSNKLKAAICGGAKTAAKKLIKALQLGKRKPSENWTLREAVEWLVPMALAGKSVRCPCCEQNVHVYYRHLNGPMARILCHMYAYDCEHPDEWMHVDDYLREKGLHNSRYHSLLTFWELTEHCTEQRDDGNPRTGLWRITENGRRFVNEELAFPEAFWMYNDENFGWATDYRDIRQALRSGSFLYPDIMRPIFPNLQFDYDEADKQWMQERIKRVTEREERQKKRANKASKEQE